MPPKLISLLHFLSLDAFLLVPLIFYFNGFLPLPPNLFPDPVGGFCFEFFYFIFYFWAVLDGLKYATSHEWVKHEGPVATIGITDHAQVIIPCFYL